MTATFGARFPLPDYGPNVVVLHGATSVGFWAICCFLLLLSGARIFHITLVHTFFCFIQFQLRRFACFFHIIPGHY